MPLPTRRGTRLPGRSRTTLTGRADVVRVRHARGESRGAMMAPSPAAADLHGERAASLWSHGTMRLKPTYPVAVSAAFASARDGGIGTP